MIVKIAATIAWFTSAFVVPSAISAPRLTVTLSSPIASFRAGQPIDFEVLVKNSGTASVVLHRQNPICDYDFVITDGSGGSIASPQSCSGNLSIGRDIIEVLQPGQYFTERVHMDRIVDMSRPGTYSVKLRRRAPKEEGAEIATSNTVIITREAN